MIFNILAATWNMYGSKVDQYPSFAINREFIRSMLADFAEAHLIDPESVMDEITSNDQLYARFAEWLREHRGFKPCKPWAIQASEQNSYQSFIGFGFEIADDDPKYVEWKLSRE